MEITRGIVGFFIDASITVSSKSSFPSQQPHSKAFREGLLVPVLRATPILNYLFLRKVRDSCIYHYEDIYLRYDLNPRITR